MKKSDFLFSRLVNLMDILRSSHGCPWDRKQNHRSLKICLIEETCEVLDAIDRKNPHKLKEELGDLLYQIVFHTRLAKEKGHFSINEVIECIYSKLIRRHPHVFEKEKIMGIDKVIEAWHKRKIKESNGSIFDDIPPILPALHKAIKVQNKLSLLGLAQSDIPSTLRKVEGGIKELQIKIKNGDKLSGLERAIGYLLFNIVNLARLLKIEPETVLNDATSKYMRRCKGSIK
ncbi:MAG: nucleoside triphosphate pyrophosphohydrolase [Candidatus Omnitrophica bacterium]|nr:nucleoside triphosphate pyrophosphohydrolase [Candidatus Omnitrophota bacterium]